MGEPAPAIHTTLIATALAAALGAGLVANVAVRRNGAVDQGHALLHQRAGQVTPCSIRTVAGAPVCGGDDANLFRCPGSCAGKTCLTGCTAVTAWVETTMGGALNTTPGVRPDFCGDANSTQTWFACLSTNCPACGSSGIPVMGPHGLVTQRCGSVSSISFYYQCDARVVKGAPARLSS